METLKRYLPVLSLFLILFLIILLAPSWLTDERWNEGSASDSVTQEKEIIK